MTEQPIHLVVADVDGTIVTSEKKLTAATVRAASELRRRGVHLALTTGRPPLGVAMLVEPLAVDSPVGCFNGGLFVTSELSPLQSCPLAATSASAIIEFLDEHHIDVWVYGPFRWWLLDRDRPHVAREEWTVQFAPETIPDFHHLDGPIIKVVGVSEDYTALAECERKLIERFGASISASRSQPYYLDVTSPRANKGQVIDFMGAYFKVAPDAIAAIGDGNNDKLMFQKCGLGIAMGNANDSVKSEAKVVVSSNDNDGFAEAIERYILRSAEGNATGRLP